MIDALQQLSGSGLPNANGILGTILMLWLVWPLVCGVLGATRGQAFKGFLNGLFWGPLGLVPVLLSSRKYICPTCGQKTLPQPASQPSGALPCAVPTSTSAHWPGAIPPVLSQGSAGSVVRPTGTRDASGLVRTANPAASPNPAWQPTLSGAPLPIPPPRSVTGEDAQLHAWLNGETTSPVMELEQAQPTADQELAPSGR